MSDRIAGVEELEKLVGKPKLVPMLKDIDCLDAHCRRLLAASTLVAIGSRDARGDVWASLVGGSAGFARILDDLHVEVPADADLAKRADGDGVGMLFLIPGLGETLRVNGRSEAGLANPLVVEVEEVFIHCAKALIRSQLWSRDGVSATESANRGDPIRDSLHDAEVAAFLSRAPFVFIASANADGRMDVSPKGDPPGFAIAASAQTLAIPDRPGNQRTDTFHNLMTRPALGLLFLVPGDSRTLRISGRGSVSADRALRERMAVNGKVPKAALMVDVDTIRLEASPALDAAALWDPSRHAAAGVLPRIADVLADHVKRNKHKGLFAAALRAIASRSQERIAGGLEKSYRDKLY